MSLTNDQITAKNFKEFYAQIRPYLNGQVPPVFNKFSKSDLYSTGEKMIGRWIDGKPIYQKTFINESYNTPLTQSNSRYVGNIDVLPANCELIKVCGKVILTDASSNVLPFEDGDLNINTSDGSINRICEKSNLGLSVTSKWNDTITKYYITLQYTKTSDSPVSIGNDTDYSTTEKIVGTWIDGKPLYQKTVECGALPNNTSKTVNHNISNVSKVLNIFGFAYKDNGDRLSLPNSSPTSTANVYINADASVVGIGTGSDRSAFTTSYITLQYTKTTD